MCLYIVILPFTVEFSVISIILLYLISFNFKIYLNFTLDSNP